MYDKISKVNQIITNYDKKQIALFLKDILIFLVTFEGPKFREIPHIVIPLLYFESLDWIISSLVLGPD